jgi:hypothetical protein
MGERVVLENDQAMATKRFGFLASGSASLLVLAWANPRPGVLWRTSGNDAPQEKAVGTKMCVLPVIMIRYGAPRGNFDRIRPQRVK